METFVSKNDHFLSFKFEILSRRNTIKQACTLFQQTSYFIGSVGNLTSGKNSKEILKNKKINTLKSANFANEMPPRGDQVRSWLLIKKFVS